MLETELDRLNTLIPPLVAGEVLLRLDSTMGHALTGDELGLNTLRLELVVQHLGIGVAVEKLVRSS